MLPDWGNPCPTPYNKAEFARHFDLEEVAFPDRGDQEVWMDLARNIGDPLLELGCGTGRVLQPLLEAGFYVTGLDESRAMLDLAREKLRGVDPGEERFDLVQAAMDSFHLKREYPLIFMPDNALWNITDGDRQRSVLFRVAEHLAPDGVFFTAMMGPGGVERNFEEFKGGFSEQFREIYNPLSGSFVTRSLAVEKESGGELLFVRYRYRERFPGGGDQESEYVHYLRVVTVEELASWAAEAGLFMKDCWGDWDGRPYDRDSPMLLAMMRKPPEPVLG
jgi:SAM-dependent methyltransferase